MPSDEASLTLALVLTAGGAVAASALVTGLVQLVKQLGTVIDGKERITAFVLSAVLVVLAMVAGVSDGTLTISIASVFAAFLAWYGIARLSMANYADVTREANGLRGPAVAPTDVDAAFRAGHAEGVQAARLRRYAAPSVTASDNLTSAGVSTTRVEINGAGG